MAKHWYAYQGPQIPTVSDYSAVSNYVYTTLYGTAIGLACVNGPSLCAIYAEGDGVVNASPNTLSNNVRSYIANGLLLSAKQPQFPAKSFAYFRPND